MLSKFSVKKPYTVVVAVVIVLIIGAISFLNLSTDLLPSMNLPYVVVYTSYPGASPEEVELTVSKPLEQSLATTSNIKAINSISSENTSMVILEFQASTDMDSVSLEISEKLDMVEAYWPDGVSSPTMVKMNPEMLPIAVLAVDKEGMDTTEVSAYVESTLMNEFEKIEGVASATATGLVEKQVEVSISQDKIDALNKKILKELDADLAEQEEKLDQAEEELSKGKSQLNATLSQQGKKLDEAESALSEGKSQLTDTKTQMEDGLAQLTQSRDILQMVLSETSTQIQNLQARVEELMQIATPTPEEAQELQASQALLDTLVPAQAEAETNLAEMEGQIVELETGLSEVDGQLETLSSQESQLQDARSKLESEGSKGRQQIRDGEAELEEGRKQFEEARDKAYEQASLDGVITVDLVKNILTAENFSMPAGYVYEEGQGYLVKVGDKVEDIDELKDLLLFTMPVQGVEEIRLADVADVTWTDNQDELYAKINGNPGVLLSLQKQTDYSTSQVCQTVNETIAQLEAEDPTLHVSVLMDQGVYIDIVIGTVLDNLIYGGLLAILILLLFLHNIRPTVVIAVSIPISVIFAIAAMYFTGVNLNLISLAGLALGVGMLVDNSIVVIENIYRMRDEGLPAKKAAVEGAKQVAGAITSSTITTICVFLPIVFTEGISRQLFTDMGLTIAYSLLASLLVALTLVPAMASGTLRSNKKIEYQLFERFKNFYGRLLDWTLKRKAVVLVFAVVMLVFSGYCATQMGTAFIPEMDSTQVSVTVQMPEDTDFKEAGALTDQVVERLMEIEDIETIGAMLGGNALLGGNSNDATLYAILREDKAKSNEEVREEIEEKTADLPCTVTAEGSSMDMSALGGDGIELIVKGDDMDTLNQIAQELGTLLGGVEGTQNIEAGDDLAPVEVRVNVDKDKAMKEGLTVAGVYNYLRTLLSETQATSLTLENQDYPVIVMEDKNSGLTRDDVKKIWIPTGEEDEKVLLCDIATIVETRGVNSIAREDQQRYVTVTADIDAGHNIGLVSRDVEAKLAEYQLPSGYTVEIAGENEMIQDTLRDLILMVGLAIVLIYLIMVAQFQSLLSPLIVMFTIPLAFTGGLLGLLIGGMEISVISMLGFLILAGVVVNNGIVFVDYINQLRKTGMPKKEAIVLAGKTRIRPILMTAITTILGLSTLALGVGTGAEMLQPLAVVTIGGMIYATLLTLFVVPALYDALNRREKKGEPEDAEDAE